MPYILWEKIGKSIRNHTSMLMKLLPYTYIIISFIDKCKKESELKCFNYVNLQFPEVSSQVFLFCPVSLLLVFVFNYSPHLFSVMYSCRIADFYYTCLSPFKFLYGILFSRSLLAGRCGMGHLLV